MKLLRVFVAICSVSVRRSLAFRANLIFQMLMTATGLGAGLAALGIVYSQTQTLGGWRLGDVIVLLGTYQIVSGVLATFIEPNVMWFAGQVKSGKLDDILLKPISSLFLASLGSCAPLELSQVMLGLVVVAVGLVTMGTAVTLWNSVGWLLMLMLGIAVMWASRVLVASVALWAPGIDLDVVYGALWQFGRYPVSIYQPPIRFVLTYVLPVAFISTLPARALTHGTSLPLLVFGLLVGLGAVMIVRTVWNLGLRRYTSATS
ncbi:MAG: ABC-2 family transporter protein [Herpetosiphonaceae bacterium]|nr:ABC-2 family transporter protein [Herpetosiphonaceae bacterium]